MFTKKTQTSQRNENLNSIRNKKTIRLDEWFLFYSPDRRENPFLFFFKKEKIGMIAGLASSFDHAQDDKIISKLNKHMLLMHLILRQSSFL